jgi:hypothetical protein
MLHIMLFFVSVLVIKNVCELHRIAGSVYHETLAPVYGFLRQS